MNILNIISSCLTSKNKTSKNKDRNLRQKINQPVEPQIQRIKLISNVKDSFNCDYVEDDIISIHNKIKDDDKYSMPMGTYLEIKIEKSQYLVILETYSKKEEKIDKNTIRARTRSADKNLF